ncbi:hypothetical protein [Mycolicibacterium mageritense]|nr:hypothetical protein [Mycolicibacterium mageritense]MCC9182500.1 hypothetical protein [Mycolicibacterium mageritense]
MPTWQQVEERTYERWDTPVLRVDTAVSIDQAVREITSAMTQGDVETPSR